MKQKLPFIKPFFPSSSELAEDLERIHKNNYYTNNGPIYFEFKEAVEKYLGQGVHAVVLNNATTALLLAIKAICEPPYSKKYIALPSFTFPAGPLAVDWCGYEPIFFDVEKSSAQPSIDSFNNLHAKYDKQLAGILIVNNFGIGNAEITKWEELSRRYKLPLIIDSAPGFGSVYPDGTLLGAHGNCEIFSLHATKPFGIGEGGLVTTRDADLASRIESLKNFGFDQDKLTTTQGMNGKITEFDCAIGLRILRDFDSVLNKRRLVYRRYEENLKNADVAFLPHAASASIQFATIVINSYARNLVLNKLSDGGIEARTYYAPAVHKHPYFRNNLRTELLNTEEFSEQVISLPVHYDLSFDKVDEICSIIRSCL
ncbi:DegT/DnrJ/EryC1/StrS family aminotransferase [Candidatus Saccharibacteria bacterium]|nr:DegT/DnrJ/EryC1/StrS family aminotransferase [Candidatus Saccharibacteria bacterium]